MQLFIQKDLQATDNTVFFDKTESRHIAKVLRKQEGDKIHITNGLGDLFICELSLVTDKNTQAKILSVSQKEKHNYYLHLAVAPTKTNDRFEWFLEKATEMGIDEITPILCERSERKNIRIDRYEKIVESALKQSLQTHLPVLNQLTKIIDLELKSDFYDEIFIAHCEDEETKVELKEYIQPNKKYLILIGPEGDFSEAEIQWARENNIKEISLGNTRLRTETAAIAACHSIAFINI